MKRYTITAALPYTNGPIHIGHLSGVYIPADIYARYLRLCGKDVVFICGSDEHGVAISIKASKEKTQMRTWDKLFVDCIERIVWMCTNFEDECGYYRRVMAGGS